jgi:hypothetical protein
MLDIFENEAFNMVSLSNSINLLPNRYGRLEELGLFPSRGVRTRTIAVEEQNGVLNLLPTMPVGSPATVGTRGTRRLKSFYIPHIPHDDVVLPEEIQGVRAFGSENELQVMSTIVTDHLQTMKDKHAITLEHLRMGALKGVVLDADGVELENLYEKFGIVQKVISFALDDEGTDVKAKCLEVLRYVEDNLMGELMSSLHCLVSADFFDALTSHPEVKEGYNRWQDGLALRSDMRKGFTFAGITFEEYRGRASRADGTVVKFIDDGDGHCFPLGTLSTFFTYFAPADFNETVNTQGLPLYAKQEIRKFERGVDIHTQSNPLPLCLRPSVLVKLTAA